MKTKTAFGGTLNMIQMAIRFILKTSQIIQGNGNMILMERKFTMNLKDGM